MNIRVLGSSGAEFPGHHLTGFLLDGEIMFDAGSLTNILDEEGQRKVKHIFVTHAHLDHTKGILFLADNIIIGKRAQKVNVFSIPPVITIIKNNLLNSSVWPDVTVIPNPRHPVVKLIGMKAGKSIKTGGYAITAYEVSHSVPAVGYLVESQKRRFFYTGDVGTSGVPWEKIAKKQIHALIIESSFPNRMEKVATLTGHLTANLLKGELSKLGRLPEMIYITHLKPQYLEAIQLELKKLRIRNLRLLRDGDTIEV